MRQTVRNKLLLACASCSLAACGGGGGGSGVPSFPAPPLPPPNFVKIFPSVTTTTDFAVLGYVESGSTVTGDGFAVRYDASKGAYLITTPGFLPGEFDATAETATTWFGGWADILKPKPANPAANFEHTTLAIHYACPWECYVGGAFAFGTATLQAAVPTTGSATYDAIVSGVALDSGSTVGGTASLQFDFGLGTLSGAFNPVIQTGGTPTSLGQYNFVNTVWGVGSPTFSGSLQHNAVSGLGSFNGLFTGPAAQELMARWKAPYVNPGTNASFEIFGVWVGRKCC